MGKSKKDQLIEIFGNPISGKAYANSDKYINRELSWLEFNKRVLYQSLRKDIPLLERLNFLGISTSNLDEFIMVRFASVINRLIECETKSELSGLSPYDEYRSILRSIEAFKDAQSECFDILSEKLKKSHIYICDYDMLNKRERDYVSGLFYRNIFPLLIPINYDTTKEFPALKSKQLNIVVALEDVTNNSRVISFIALHDSFQKIYRIPSDDGKEKYILLEQIVYAFLSKIYVNKNIVSYGSIKLLRKADIELKHDKDVYITDRMRSNLLEREYSTPIFMDASSDISKSLLKILIRIFELDKHHVYVSDTPIDYTVFQGMTSSNLALRYNSFTPQYPSELIGEHDMFSAIDNGDILIHHPYESFDPVIKLLEHAAENPDVLSIKQTLYRVSSTDSPIVEALCRAANNGKQVAVILEIKARFDEERNISLIEKLRLAGCKLIYGVEDLKTHCKFIMVVKKYNGGLRVYSHIGTGNYNDKTAKIYTDISYFTSNFKVGQDLNSVFNMLSGFSEPTGKINKIYFSPYNLRKKLYNCIDNEIELAKNGKKGIIVFKVNSVNDKEMIDRLYKASEKGVKITIFCRGICSMKPVNKNITIRSLVGRFLEHSRIYYFGNNSHPDVFISSADLLTRNLDKRFELLFPVKDDGAISKLLKILAMYYSDTFNSYQMDKKGNYLKLVGKKKEVDIHRIFMEEAIANYKMKNIPKMMPSGDKKKK